MHRSELDSWVGRTPAASRAATDLQVTLLPQDPYATTANEGLPFRSTTYDAKYVAPAPFQAGTVYMQGRENAPEAHPTTAAEAEAALLAQLYTAGYLPFSRTRHESRELGFCLPSEPPDFDGSAPTSPEFVAQHVHGLARAYNSVDAPPTPFDMYQQTLRDATTEFAALCASAQVGHYGNDEGEDVSTNTPPHTSVAEASGPSVSGRSSSYCTEHDGADGGASGEDSDDEAEETSHDRFYAPPALDAAAFSLSVSFASLPLLTRAGVEVLRRRLMMDHQSTRLMDSGTVKSTLHHCQEAVGSAAVPLAHKGELLALVGLLVCSRGRISELVRYLGTLESFHNGCADIVPAAIPHASAVVAALCLHTAPLCRATSPIDCLQDEPRRLRVSLGEGITVQCFCASPDGRLLAVATREGITVFERSTGSIVAERVLTNDAGGNVHGAGAGLQNPGSSSIPSLGLNDVQGSGPGTSNGDGNPSHGNANPNNTNDNSNGNAFSAESGPESLLQNALLLGGAAPEGGADGGAGSGPGMLANFTLHSMAFSPDSTHLMASQADDLRHFVFASDLSTMEEHVSASVAVPCDYRDGVLEELPLPFLPSGCVTHAMHLAASAEPLFVSSEKLAAQPLEEITVCAHVGANFVGVVALLTAERDELLVSVCGNIVSLTQSGQTCHGVVTSEVPWMFLEVRWVRGTWLLVVNGCPVTIRGPRTGQVKSMLVKKVTCVHGKGRIASFSLWAANDDAHGAVKTYGRERRLEPGVMALVNLPLDEGKGVWIKETVSGTCLTLSDTQFAWDDSSHPPFTTAAASSCFSSAAGGGAAGRDRSRKPRTGNGAGAGAPATATRERHGHSVRLDEQQYQRGQVLTSAFKTYIVLPPKMKGSDETVLEVDRATNTIINVYGCPWACAENLYSLLWDESELVIFQPRFGAFSVACLYTRRGRENELRSNGFLECSAPRESVLWLLRELYRKLYVEASELYRVPAQCTPVSVANLRRITQLLYSATATCERLRVVALLSLALVHFLRLQSTDEQELSQLAVRLKEACARIVDLFDNALIRDLATRLLVAATRRSLTMPEKVNALLGDDLQRSATILKECMSKESLFAVIHCIVTVNSPGQLVDLAKRLLLLGSEAQHRQAATGEPSGSGASAVAKEPTSAPTAAAVGGATDGADASLCLGGSGVVASTGETTPVAQYLKWFVLSSLTVLRAAHELEVISQLLELFLAHTVAALSATATATALLPQQTTVHTGCLPLLVLVADLCPEAVTPDGERLLLQLLEAVRGDAPCALESEQSWERLRTTTVVFTTHQVCDVYPCDRESLEGSWRLRFDFRQAKCVSVHKETTSAELCIARVRGERDAKAAVVETSAGRPFVKVDGGELLLYGSGENVFTVVAQFELPVDGSWTALLRDVVQHVLVSHACQLTRRTTVSEAYVPFFTRHGLSSSTLQRHGITLAGRNQASQLATSILQDNRDGKECVDHVVQTMRGSVVPSMRPAIQAMLAILIHCGATVTQAADELKLRWSSGEWGSKLQGPTRDTTRAFLHDLAVWVTSSLSFQPDGLGASATSLISPAGRRASTDRRHELSLNASRSVSERRASTSSRRSLFRSAQYAEALDQVRTLLSKNVATEELEAALAQRTATALKMVHGLDILGRLLALIVKQRDTLSAAVRERVVQQVLQAVWAFMDVDSGAHFLDSLSGAGAELEGQVRSGLHAVLSQCSRMLLSDCPEMSEASMTLCEAATNGRAAMTLLAILCHPWDVVDCEFFNSTFGAEDDLLQHLENQMNMPMDNLIRALGAARGKQPSHGLTSVGDDMQQLTDLKAAADMNSLSLLLPNDFSVAVPQLETSRSDSGVIIEKHGPGSFAVRADEGWPREWREGMPRVLYYEVKLNAAASGVEVGLITQQSESDPTTHVNLFYSASGEMSESDIIETSSAQLPGFGTGDTVGCGFAATTRDVFFTLNGKMISSVGLTSVKKGLLFPTIRFDETFGVKVRVNFGTAPFAFDFRQLHPALQVAAGPSWYRVGTTAEMVLHYITARACAVQETKRPSAKVTLSHCCEAVCRNVNKVTSSLMNIGVLHGTSGSGISGGSGKDADTRTNQAVMLTVTECSLMMLIATVRQVVNAGAAHGPLPDVVGEMIFDAASVLMLLPLRSIQISTISLLPEVIPYVRQAPDSETSSSLVHTLFAHARAPAAPDAARTIPFVPRWRECDSRCMSISNVQFACMVPEAQRSIVLGNPLPRTGVVSFTVRINRRGMSKGHSLKGGYFIGVSIAGLSPLSPTSNSQSWKAVKPPIVWAIHDTTPQLPHATNPTVKPNNFQRTFGNDDSIRVIVDRDSRTVGFHRDDTFLQNLFNDLPSDAELVPFVQLYNDDASAFISPGEMTAPISAVQLLSAASVDVLRSMLTLEPFQHLVASVVCQELDRSAYPAVALALFNSLPNPRLMELRCGASDAESVLIHVSRITDMRCKFSIGNKANYEHVHNLRTPAVPQITCSLDSTLPIAALDGLRLCIGKLVTALQRLVWPLVTLKALSCLEREQRQNIIDEERDRWDFLVHGLRVSSFLNIQQASQQKSLITVPSIPTDFTFSAELSHPRFAISPNYCGRLATVPSGAVVSTPPFIAIAEPSIPSTGRFSIRCQLIRGHNGQILGGGYYFGVCTENFNWQRKELNRSAPEVWAFHDMDDTPWRLRHLNPNAVFPITAEPRCIIVSGDIIRLEIDRDKGTIHVYRKPMNGDEVPLGLVYDKIPSDVKLYPFIHLFNVDAVAVLLPTNSTDPAMRLTVQQPHFAISETAVRRFCDGCTAAHSESKLGSHWYKCNECADYALCGNCFSLCVHSHHAFTEMGSGHFVYSTLPPLSPRPGMRVVLPGTNCMYLRSSGCRMREDQINCVAECIEDHGFAIWGLVCDKKGRFTAVVDTTDGEPLATDHPMFIGVGLAEEVMKISREKLRNRCFTSASPAIVAYCSDYTLRRKMQRESRHPYGFQRGATITVEVDVAKRTVSFVRDWIVVGVQPIDLPAAGTAGGSAGRTPPLCCFVMFGRKNTKASVFPERGRTVVATVEDASSGIVKVVTFPHNTGMRYARVDSCRLPLDRATAERGVVGSLGFTFIEKEFVQCRVEAAADAAGDGLVVRCLQTDTRHTIPLRHFLVDADNAIAEERLIHHERKEDGATPECGFVISRLLLILSCLCENETMSSLVMAHGRALGELLRSLASVHITDDAPLNFLPEIRNSVASTASYERECDAQSCLDAFVPTLNADDRRRKFRPGMLVRSITAAGGTTPAEGGIGTTGKVFRVRSRKGEVLTVENIATHEQSQLLTKNSVMVKQGGERPWFTLRNGLPVSLYEHTMRLKETGAARQKPTNYSVDGVWQGEMSLLKSLGRSVELHLKSTPVSPSLSVDATGWKWRYSLVEGTGSTAVVVEDGNEKTFAVLFEHARYGRTVRMCLIPPWNVALMTRACEVHGNAAMHFSEKVRSILLAGSTGATSLVYTIEATVDAEGLRMSGVCLASDGKLGAFSANWDSRVSLAPVSTEVGHVEPLPDCADAVILAAPRRGLCDTLHRLVVLLARHLYLVLSDATQQVSTAFVEHIFLFHHHPLSDRLASRLVGVPNLFFMVSEACQLILNPSVRPWDAAALSSLAANTLLLRPEMVRQAPDSLVWDTLHAVVVAAHRCGCYYRHEILRKLTSFVQARSCEAAQPIYAQLFAALFSHVDGTALKEPEREEVRRDISAGVDFVLAVKGPMEATLQCVPTQSLRCLVDLWRSLRDGEPLSAIVDTAVNCSEDNAATEEVTAQWAFGDFKDGVLKVGKVKSSCSVGRRGLYYYEVMLPDRLSSPYAIGWGTEAHCDVPGQHVGSDEASFAFNGNDVSTKNFKEEYKVSIDITPNSVIGCLLDMNSMLVAWSVGGARGPFIPLPMKLKEGETLFAYVSIGTCSGMEMRMQAHQFEYVPDSYTDTSHRSTRVLVDAYDEKKRSVLPVQPLHFYSQLALYLSDLDELAEDADTTHTSNPSQIASTPTATATVTATATAMANSNNEASPSGSGGIAGAATVSPTGAASTPEIGARIWSRQTVRRSSNSASGRRNTMLLAAAQGANVNSNVQQEGVGSGANQTLSATSMTSLPVVTVTAAASVSVANTTVTAEDMYLPKYQALMGVPRHRLEAYARVIATVESCMATANRFVDLDGETVCGDLSMAFVYLKPLVRRGFREKLLVNIPSVEKTATPPTITIRVTELYSTLPRTPEVALQHTVLSQLFKQIGVYTTAQWAVSPLFKVNLHISGSGHTPIDMGGPYRQLWTFLAEEVMRHPDRCYPHSDFHRNPLFIFVNNSQRVSLVPDAQANASYELALFNFFGKIMGHAARAKFPLDIDFSPFFWKFLVDDTLTVNDYYQHVDSVVETSMLNDSFLLGGIAEEIIPGFAERLDDAEGEGGANTEDATNAHCRRAVAEDCLVHSMDEQLGAMRSGLWSVLPRRVVRCLYWRDLERLVCGETNPTVDDLKRFIHPQLSATREKFFWLIVSEMTAEQKASLLCFASGQRRLPLIRSISVQENSESVEHLPRAQSCSSLITIPTYTSLDVFREKLLIALQHQAEMELA